LVFGSLAQLVFWRVPEKYFIKSFFLILAVVAGKYFIKITFFVAYDVKVLMWLQTYSTV
jgi:hypothetical protein